MDIRGLVNEPSIVRVRLEVRVRRGDKDDVLERVVVAVEQGAFHARVSRALDGAEQLHVQGLDAADSEIAGAEDSRDVAPPKPSAPQLVGNVREGMRTVAGMVEAAAKGTTVEVRVYSSDLIQDGAPPARTQRAMVSHSDRPSDNSSNEERDRVLLQFVTGVAVGENLRFLAQLDQALVAGQVVRVTASAGGMRSEAVRRVVDSFGDWGRVRTYFAGGVVLSRERGQFSQQDLNLTFAMDKSWLQGCDSWLGSCDADRSGGGGQDDLGSTKLLPRQLNTFFNVSLTAIPVEAQTDATPAEDTTAFLASKKVAVFEAGIYVPFYGRALAWTHDGAPNTLFIAPVLRGGFQTLTEDQRTAEATVFKADDVLHFWSAGVGLGHYKLSGSRDRAPELISYLHVTYGNWENFGEPTADTPSGSWRWAFEGRLKIPGSPLQVGFNANVGDGRDDVRFIFGTRFDLGALIAKLRTFEP